MDNLPRAALGMASPFGEILYQTAPVTGLVVGLFFPTPWREYLLVAVISAVTVRTVAAVWQGVQAARLFGTGFFFLSVLRVPVFAITFIPPTWFLAHYWGTLAWWKLGLGFFGIAFVAGTVALLFEMLSLASTRSSVNVPLNELVFGRDTTP